MERRGRALGGEGGGKRGGVAAAAPAGAVDEAEGESLRYLVENSCITCDKLLPRYTVRILVPAYMQERDASVRGGIARRRLMCVDCYNSMRVAHRQRMVRNPMAQRRPLLKELVASFLLE